MGILFWFLSVWSAISAAGVPQEKVLQLQDVVLDRAYPAMSGPKRYSFFQGLPEDFWLLGSKIEIRNKKTGKTVPQSLCHSRLAVARIEGLDFNTLRIVNDNPKFEMDHLLSLSQGQFEMEFPEGFGMPIHMPAGRKGLIYGVQYQRESEKGRDELQTRTSVKIMDADSARAAGLKPLYSFIMPVTLGEKRHWIVPPGKHRYVTRMRVRSAQAEELKVHYIRIHLHAYGTGIELYNVTEDRVVWRATAKTDLKTGALSHTDFYSSREGFVLKPGEVYEVRADYDNPLKKSVDAMAMLNLYLNSPSAMADFRPFL